MADIIGTLNTILNVCQRMRLSVSERAILRIIAEFEKKKPSAAISKQRYLEWYTCFQSEVEAQIYLLVLPHRVGYWNSEADQLEGVEVASIVTAMMDAFPSAIYDVREAANCFAFERFTACVYHLMRVAEYGLIAVAGAIGVPEDKRTSWDKLIGGIHSRIKALSSTAPPGWKEEEKKYANFCSWFTMIQLNLGRLMCSRTTELETCHRRFPKKSPPHPESRWAPH